MILPTQMPENFGSYQLVFEKNIGSFWLEPKAYFGSARAKKIDKVYWLGTSWDFFGSFHPYSSITKITIQQT